MKITRTKTYVLTALAAFGYVLLMWLFTGGSPGHGGTSWDQFKLTGGADPFLYQVDDGIKVYALGTIWTYVFLAVIVLGGIYQARRLRPEGTDLDPAMDTTTPGQIEDPKGWKLIMGNAYLALLWLPLRFYIGQEWLAAGEHKIRDDAWGTGEGLLGYWQGAVAVPEQGRPRITYDWYRDFLQGMIDRESYTWFADVIAWGEFFVGLGLVVGALVGIAAFFGTLMNVSFLLAGSTSSNPILLGLGILIVLGWKVAGYVGLDRVLLPALGTPWKPGRIVPRRAAPLPSQPTTTAA